MFENWDQFQKFSNLTINFEQWDQSLEINLWIYKCEIRSPQFNKNYNTDWNMSKKTFGGWGGHTLFLPLKWGLAL